MTDALPRHRPLDGVIEASWLAALVLVPVVMAPEHAQSFPHPKAAVAATFAALGLAAWAAKALAGGGLRPPLAPDRRATGGRRRLLLGVAVTALAVVLGATLAIAPRLAWLGAGERAMGAVTQLSVIALTLLMLGHLRRRAQLRRALEALALASLPLCLYALLQAFGADPLPGAASPRPPSLAGNANIVGRFLVTAIFLTAGLLLDTEARARETWNSGLRQGLLVGLLGLQTWTLLVTGGRGPLLGLIAGALTLAASFSVLRRAGRPPRAGARRLAAVASLAVLAFAALGWRHAVTRPGAPLARGAATLVDAGSRTARVRLALWRAAATAARDRSPLPGASGPDRRTRLRPWLGHGPGLAGPPLVRAAGPALAELEPGKIPDQAHNETWNRLLTGGLVAVGGWFLLHGALAELLLGAFGLLPRRRDAARLWASLAAGAAGGLAAGSLPGVAAGLSVPLAVAGALLGAALWAVAGRRRDSAAPVAGARLTAWIAAAVVARLVAGQVGNETVTDALLAGALLALAAGAAAGLEDAPRGARGIAAEPAASVVPPAAAALAAVLLWAFALSGHGPLAAPVARTARPVTLVWLVGATLIVAAGLAPRGTRRRLAVATLAALVAPAAASALLARHFGALVAGGATSPFAAQARLEIWLAATLLAGLTVGAALYGARALGPAVGAAHQVPKPRRLAIRLAVAALAAAALYATALRPLSAGFLQRGAQRASSAAALEPARALAAAAARAAGDPSHAAILEAAIERRLGQAAGTGAGRDAHFDRAAAALTTALGAAPFDSDLVGNLGLLDLERLRYAPQDRQQELAARAAARFAAALALRPVGGPWEAHLATARALASGAAAPAPEAPRLDGGAGALVD